MLKSTLKKVIALVLALTMIFAMMIPSFGLSVKYTMTKTAKDFFTDQGAKNALTVLNNATYKPDYDDSDSAAQIENMIEALDVIEQTNKHRKTKLMVSHSAMAMAICNADYSAKKQQLTHNKQFNSLGGKFGFGHKWRSENLALNKDAVSGVEAWYAEKSLHDKGDRSTKSGHYRNMVNSQAKDAGAAVSKINHETTRMNENNVYCEVFQDKSSKDKLYSVDDYRDMLEQYYEDNKTPDIQGTINATINGNKGEQATVKGLVYEVTTDNLFKHEVKVLRSTSTNGQTSIVIPASVEIDGTTYDVAEVAAGAFSGRSNLVKLSFYGTVDKIGNNAIKGCNSKMVIKVPKDSLSKYQKLFTSATGFVSTMTLKGANWG